MVSDPFYSRRLLMITAVVLTAATFIYRLFHLQIASSDYKYKAERNAYYKKTLYPARGVIYDRKGRLLVGNQQTYDLMVTMVETKQIDTLALADILGLEREVLAQKMLAIKDRKQNRSYSAYTPQVLTTQLSEEEAARFQEQLYKFPGFSIRNRSIRSYHYQHAAHILGYLSEANPQDLEVDSLVARGDYVGKAGVEKSYEKYLRGDKGFEVLLRDARGRIKGSYLGGAKDVAPRNGHNLNLSIDADLQALGESLMQGKRGAIVALEPKTGEVLALVTAPNYPPELLAQKQRKEQYRQLEIASGKPLINRAIMGTYPPGSTFKAAQAAIFLQEGILQANSRLSCSGGYPLLGGRPKCHPHTPAPDVVYSLSTSCNAYYCWGMHYLLDKRDRFSSIQEAFEIWKDHIVQLGYGYRTGIDLQGEKRGYIPNSNVYDKLYKRWSSSSIISISIGQGEILATPLQTANLAAIIANNGFWYRPHVVRNIEGLPLDTMYTKVKHTGINSKWWEYVREGMSQAVKYGTCKAANFSPKEFEVCGKTGTAQNPHGKDHSAFIGFAPRENARIAIGVYVENGGFGANFGVPIGRVMMEYYLKNGQLSEESQNIASKISATSIAYYLND